MASKTGEVKYLLKGEQGDIGPLVYPAGEYASDASYTRTALSAPMVLCEGQYYVLNKAGTFKGINPKTDYAANGSKATWVLMDKVQYAFFDVVMANFAKFASAVFHGDYMFSQQGIDASDNDTSQYDSFNHNDPLGETELVDFVPNFCINLRNGRQFLGKRGSMIFEPKGDIKIRGAVIYPTEIKTGNDVEYIILPGDNINRVIVTGNSCNVELVGSRKEAGREITIDYLPSSLYTSNLPTTSKENRLVIRGRTAPLEGVDDFVSSPVYNGVSFNNYISLAVKTSAKFRLVPVYNSYSGTIANYRWLLVEMTPYDPLFGTIYCEFYSGMGDFMFRSKYYQNTLDYTSNVNGNVTTYKIDMTGIIGSDETNCLITHHSVYLDCRTSGNQVSIGSFSLQNGKTYLTITSSNASPTFNGMIILYSKLGNL